MFLGHEIPEMSRSINIRDIIAARAEACVRHPPLVFDYDHQNNCEAFANLLIGAADTDKGGLSEKFRILCGKTMLISGVLGVQADNTHWCVLGLCCLINCFKSCRSRISLQEVVGQRIRDV